MSDTYKRSANFKAGQDAKFIDIQEAVDRGHITKEEGLELNTNYKPDERLTGKGQEGQFKEHRYRALYKMREAGTGVYDKPKKAAYMKEYKRKKANNG